MLKLGIESVEGREMMAANPFGELGIANPDNGQQMGLLLPAVQKVREAAARTNTMPVDWNLTNQPTDPDAILIGLLLPAVQKVR